jgi:hypothetical protein
VRIPAKIGSSGKSGADLEPAEVCRPPLRRAHNPGKLRGLESEGLEYAQLTWPEKDTDITQGPVTVYSLQCNPDGSRFVDGGVLVDKLQKKLDEIEPPLTRDEDYASLWSLAPRLVFPSR